MQIEFKQRKSLADDIYTIATQIVHFVKKSDTHKNIQF